LTLLHRFITNAGWNIGGKAVVQLLYFFLSVLISRYLGEAGLGIYASLLVVPAFVRLFNSLGLEGMLNKKLPELNVQDPAGGQGRYLLIRVIGLRLFTTALMAFLLYEVLPVFAGWAHQPAFLQYRGALVWYFAAISVNSILGMVFMTLLRFKIVAVAEALNALLNVLLLGIFIALDAGIGGVLAAYILATFAQILLYLALARPWLTGPRTPTDLTEARRLAWTIYGISFLSVGLWTQSDVLLMNFFQVSPVRVGYYHLATSLGAMVIFVMAGVGQLAQSLYAESFAGDGARGLTRTWRLTIGFTAWVTVPLGVFAFTYAPELVTWIYGSVFEPVATVFRVVAFFVVLSAILGFDLNNFVLFVLHRRRTALLISLEGSLWNLALDVLWIPRFAELGAALATGSVMLYMVLRQLFALRDTLQVGAVLPLTGQSLATGLAALVPGVILEAWWEPHVLTQALVYGAGYLALLVLVKPLSPEWRPWVADLPPRLGRWAEALIR